MVPNMTRNPDMACAQWVVEKEHENMLQKYPKIIPKSCANP